MYLPEMYSLAKKDDSSNAVRIRKIHWLNYGWGAVKNDLGWEKMIYHPEQVWLRMYSLSTEAPWKRVKLTIHHNTPCEQMQSKDLQKMAKKHLAPPPPPSDCFVILNCLYMNILEKDENKKV